MNNALPYLLSCHCMQKHPRQWSGVIAEFSLISFSFVIGRTVAFIFERVLGFS